MYCKDIIADSEENDGTSYADECDAQQGGSAAISQLRIPPGLLNKVLPWGDRIVMLASKLISSETSNLAE